MKRILIAGALLIAVLAAVLPVALASSERASATTISVTGKEFTFRLSRKSAPHGTLVFKFKNVGSVGHDFKIAGKKTPIIQPGASAKLTVRIAKAGKYKYLCTVPGHAAAGMKGTFTVR